jgi:hypothetical protein
MWWEHFQKYNQTLRCLRAGLGFEFDKVRRLGGEKWRGASTHHR